MERDAERLAWTVLGVAFVVFCFMLLGIPQAARWYVVHAMTERPVQLQVLKGTTFLLPSGGRQEVNAFDGMAISAGSRIRTAADSKAFLSLFDGSNIQLWPETTLHVVNAESTRYSSNDTRLVLSQDQGHARYEVAMPTTLSRRFELFTPQADVLLREGSYKVEVANGTTTVTVSDGSATVSVGSHAVEALRGEWVKVPTGGIPSKPGPSIHDLIANGDFSQGWEGWQQGTRGVEDNVPGRISIGEEADRSFVEFERTGSDKHAEDYIHKTLNEDVTDESTLKFNFQLRVQQQSLPGGGILGSEYPLIARVHYRDSAGNEADWMRGFYIQTDKDHPTTNGASVIANQWTDESYNLFDSSVVSPRPAEILWIEIAASGHEYSSDVTRVELLAD
ncbi:MAG TPA: FecR family protein [Chloroflexota bacterium]|nr:FecR family protein [Chloroflexota bacterium]